MGHSNQDLEIRISSLYHFLSRGTLIQFADTILIVIHFITIKLYSTAISHFYGNLCMKKNNIYFYFHFLYTYIGGHSFSLQILLASSSSFHHYITVQHSDIPLPWGPVHENIFSFFVF
jgi:hypothetical protein